MVKSPKDIQPFVEEKERRFRERVESLEASIDNFLIEKAPKIDELIHYALPINQSEEVIQRVMLNYRDAGWQVNTWKGSQHDPSNDLVFKYTSGSIGK